MKKKRFVCVTLFFILLLAGCNNTNKSSTLPEESSTETSPVEKINGEVMSFEEAKNQVNSETFTVELRYEITQKTAYYQGYDIEEQVDYDKIEELLRVYFKSFFEQKYWANYDFVDDSVMNRWEDMYQSIITKGKTTVEELEQQTYITLYEIYYNDDEDYYIEVVGMDSKFYTHYMHLKKIEEQWCVVNDCISYSNVTGEETFPSKEDQMLAIEMRKEIIQKAREKNPLTEAVIQEGIEAAIDLGFYHYLSEEELELLKPKIEGIYEEEWCDSLLRLCIDGYGFNFNQPIFLVWCQVKDGYDTSLEELKEKAFHDKNGEYRLVRYVPEEGWIVEELIFINLPDYDKKDNVQISTTEDTLSGEVWKYIEE